MPIKRKIVIVYSFQGEWAGRIPQAVGEQGEREQGRREGSRDGGGREAKSERESPSKQD